MAGVEKIGRRALVAILLGLSTTPVAADCLDEAAAYWRVPNSLARAVAMQESGLRADAVGKNTNGSRDIGLMQINTSWLPTLRKYNIAEADLYDPCINAYIGNWILAQNIERLGFNWNAVGAYNAASPHKRDAYARKVYRQLMTLQEGGPQSIRHGKPPVPRSVGGAR